MRSPGIGFALVLLGIGLLVGFVMFADAELAQTREGALRQLAAMGSRDAELLAQWRGERLADGKTFSSGLPERLASWRAQTFLALPEVSALTARLQATLAAYDYAGVRLYGSAWLGSAGSDSAGPVTAGPNSVGRAMISLVAPGVPLQALDQLNPIAFDGEEPTLTPLRLVAGRPASMILSIPL